MLKVGVTGGIGSGKTLVCKIFEKLAVPVFYADVEAAIIIHKSTIAKEKLIAEFGNALYVNGLLNKPKMRQLIFNNDANLIKVNNIVHPLVKEQFLKFVELNHSSKYVIQEAAILFETGANKTKDKVITITAPEHVRLQRILSREGMSVEIVEKIMQKQMPEEQKAAMSDYVIENCGERLLINQVIEIHNKLKEL